MLHRRVGETSGRGSLKSGDRGEQFVPKEGKCHEADRAQVAVCTETTRRAGGSAGGQHGWEAAGVGTRWTMLWCLALDAAQQ